MDLNSKDDKFAENVAGAHAVGLKVGAYHYYYALNVEDAIQEAANCRETIDNASVALGLPEFYNMEDLNRVVGVGAFLLCRLVKIQGV
jgi:GH25 family lysozyme M1 (1,4-beta-N-acetylmuramidase)